jgi:dipeptidyl aminopeptidase/acylaminoacyl peptidase
MRASVILLLAKASAAGLLVAQDAPRFVNEPTPVEWRGEAGPLAGVLLLPAGNGPFPAVILVHGAGPGSHDDPAFIVHANAFVAGGFAVLSYDKRGSGNSAGTLGFADYDDLADDLSAAVAFLRRDPRIDHSRISLLGRSEGAWVAAIAAARDPTIAAVVFSSGSLLSPRDQVLAWTRESLARHRATPAEAEAAVAAKLAQWDFNARVADGSLTPAAAAPIRESLLARLAMFARFRPEIPRDVMDPATEDRQRFVAFTRMITWDPAPTLAALRVPVLAVFGEHDDVVPPGPNLAEVERLRASGRDIAARVFPGVDHSLLVMSGERIVGYPPEYLPFLIEWASRQGRR